MEKICSKCAAGFDITEADQKFYKKMGVPAPTFCPDCRVQRRLAFRNDRSLYKSKSVLSGKEIITMYHPHHGYTVYDQKEWYGDQWNPLDYGRNIDFERPFFAQFAELQKKVPRFNVFNIDTENCEFVNYAPHCKNCYLLFGSWFDEDCLYGQTLNECKTCVDNLFVDKSEISYENIDSDNLFNSSFCQNSGKAVDSYFCFDCQNVKNCIGCWNLRNKSYHVLNKPITKGQFEAEKGKLALYSYQQQFKKKFADLVRNEAIHRDFIGQNNQNVSGNFIFNCKNCQYCFSVYRCEDMAFCGRLFDQKDTYDFDGGGKGELTYEAMSNDFAYNSISCTTCEHLKESHYCDLCFSCQNCFGCVGLRHAKYCILNKQYSKSDYEALVSKLIDHMKQTKEWGEFFSVQLSPFAYNETMAQEYYPLSKEEAKKQGFRWSDYESPPPSYQKIIPAEKLPDQIKDIPDDVLNWAIKCEKSGKLFKIQVAELKFYRKMNLPLPHLYPDVRHADRMAMRNPRKLFSRTCTSCGKAIRTSYAPERPEKVYCEECYLKAVY